MTIDAVHPIEDEAALRVCFPIMHQPWPHFADADELVTRWHRQVQGGCHFTAVWRGGVSVALAGYRQQESFVYGPFLHADDLATDVDLRGSGLGSILMSHLKVGAECLGCTWLVLDTPLSNMLGHRFYYRNGLFVDALRFGMNAKTRAAR